MTKLFLIAPVILLLSLTACTGTQTPQTNKPPTISIKNTSSASSVIENQVWVMPSSNTDSGYIVSKIASHDKLTLVTYKDVIGYLIEFDNTDTGALAQIKQLKQELPDCSIFNNTYIEKGYDRTYSNASSKISTSTPVSDILYVDVREDDEWAAGHIKGALHVKLGDIEAGKVDAIPKDREIAVYCRSGRRSAIAANALKGLGYTRIQDAGGMTSVQGVGIVR